MPEAATTTAGSPPPAAPSVASAGASLAAPPPQVNMQGASWMNEFKNEDLKNYAMEKKFTSPEQMAERYKNLEGLRGVPEDRLLKLPEKMDGPEANIIWEKLGKPKDAAGYEFVDEGQDPEFLGWAKETFLKNNVPKSMAHAVVKDYNDMMTKSLLAQKETRQNAILQADNKLQKEWGAQYETNVNLAKQGAKVLGLDAKTLDIMEALQGREAVYKNLQKIGVGVGESNFVDGAKPPQTTTTTPEQAQAEIKQLINDKKFGKALSKGDAEALERWNNLNRLAAPGEKQLG